MTTTEKLTIMSTRFRSLFLFYRSLAPWTILVSLLLCALLVAEVGALRAAGAVLLSKVFANGATFALLRTFKNQEIYFYHNLGWTERGLWLAVFALDFAVLLGLMALTDAFTTLITP